jgi:GPH family glycoside/pentoside/hexuronide:cation symporter
MSAPATPALQDPAAKLGWTEKFGYAAGDMASCLFFGIFMNFMAIFYTDVFGISAAALGTMLLLVRTWDWVNDPIMGLVADRTKSPMGKFRPWILWMILPYMACGVLTFYTPDVGPTAKLVYAYVTYTMMMMVYTAINVPYGALMGVMTAKSEERTVLASFRFIGANAGIFAVTLMLPFLVNLIGRGDQQVGYTGAVAVLALMAGALFFFTFKTSKERIRPLEQKPEPIGRELRELLRNGPWLMIIVISILTVMSQAIRASSVLHYFKYVVGREDWGTTLLVYNSVAAVVAVLLAKWICSLIGGKKRAYIILNLLFAVLLVWFYFIPREAFGLMVLNQVLMALVAAPMMPLFWAMIADTADYGAVKFGHRSTGVIFSAGTASQKIGWSIGPALAFWLLGYSGFVANVGQSATTNHTLLLLMSLIPAGFAVATAVATLFYKIDRKMETELEKTLVELNRVRSAAS